MKKAELCLLVFFGIVFCEVVSCAGPGYDAGNDVVAQERNLYRPLGAKGIDSPLPKETGKGCVFGTIRAMDAMGSSLSGATVHFYNHTEKLAQQQSNTQGEYSFCISKNYRDSHGREVKSISLRIVVIHSGYQEKEFEKRWNLDAALHVDMRLSPSEH
ncbi:MAG: hypothetical protein IPJ88_17720 [Myxococcales bacterium]|nr:MAG: hypothetical protein IPJ88_17720 [Myxococcales bacterium]